VKPKKRKASAKPSKKKTSKKAKTDSKKKSSTPTKRARRLPRPDWSQPYSTPEKPEWYFKGKLVGKRI